MIQCAAFDATGLDWTFVAFDVSPDDGPGAVDAMRRLNLAGLSVTMPHKSSVIEALDDLTDAARALGAVNCIYREGDRLVGDNTDGDGLLRSLRHDLDIEVRDRRCLVVGAGGAGRSVIAALGRAGAADIVVVNRSADRGAAAAAAGGDRARVGTVEDAATASVIVNATSMGMEGASAGLPVPPELVPASSIVVDLVYHPLETRWLAELRARGVRSVNGVGMLVGQAALAFERWTGLEAPYEAMSAAVADVSA